MLLLYLYASFFSSHSLYFVLSVLCWHLCVCMHVCMCVCVCVCVRVCVWSDDKQHV